MSSLIRNGSVKERFLSISVIGAMLLTVFAGIAILKSDAQTNRSWASVLKKRAQSLLITPS